MLICDICHAMVHIWYMIHLNHVKNEMLIDQQVTKISNISKIAKIASKILVIATTTTEQWPEQSGYKERRAGNEIVQVQGAGFWSLQEVEWNKNKYCFLWMVQEVFKQKGIGYYDNYKNGSFTSDIDVIRIKKILTGY